MAPSSAIAEPETIPAEQSLNGDQEAMPAEQSLPAEELTGISIAQKSVAPSSSSKPACE